MTFLFSSSTAAQQDPTLVSMFANSTPLTLPALPAEPLDVPRKKKQEIDTNDKDARTLFVANVPVKTEAYDTIQKLKIILKRHFETYGPVESVRVRSLGVKIVDVRPPSGSDQRMVRRLTSAKNELDTRLETCNAYVVFDTMAGFDAALANADGSIFHAHHLRVDRTDGGGQGGKIFERARSVFVGSIPYEASEEKIRMFFEKELVSLMPDVPTGRDVVVESVRVVHDPATNMGRGIAYVLFRSKAMASKALMLNGAMFDNREIRVEPCEKSRTNAKSKSKKERAAFFAVDRKKESGNGGGTKQPNWKSEGGVKRTMEVVKESHKRHKSSDGEKKKNIPVVKRDEESERLAQSHELRKLVAEVKFADPNRETQGSKERSNKVADVSSKSSGKKRRKDDDGKNVQ